MGPIWGRQDPGGPHVGPMNFAIWEYIASFEEQLLYLFIRTSEGYICAYILEEHGIGGGW